MTYARKEASPDWLALWILFSAWSTLSGWCLAVFGYLNPAGIIFSYLLFIAALILFRSHLQNKGGRLGWRRVLRSRYIAPRIWLLLALLALVGGIAYSPNNYDYLTYRFPRVLYWSWNHGWIWIPTVNERMNYSGTGFEWLMVPLFILFKTDRLFFLINFISYLLLPGLVFSIFSRLGISKRISWWWMWILPCGYCYILQAGSAGNDAFTAIYFLASLHYLFRTKTSFSVKNPALSCLAIALMTGVKASNLPMVLPWLIAVFLYRKYLLGKSAPAIIAVIPIAAAISFLPVALLNFHFIGDYIGDPTNKSDLRVGNPVSAMLGNSIELAEDNLIPPVMPRPIHWRPFLPAPLKAKLLRDFPRLDWHSGELQIEERAGPGLGIVLFLALFIVMGMRVRLADPGLIAAQSNHALGVAVAGVVAWLVYMSRMGSEATSRLLAVYYPLLIAGILVAVSLDGRIVCRRVFNWFGFIAMLSAIPPVILCPARPLFPTQAVADLMTRSHVPAAILARYNTVYTVYATRSEALKELAAAIPPNEQVIGFLQAGNDSSVSLWRPFGTRKIIEVTPEDSTEEVKARGIHFVVVSQNALTNRYHTTRASLLVKWSGSLVEEKSIALMASEGPETWYVLGLW